MLFNYILCYYNVSVKVIKCEKCKKTAIFTEQNHLKFFLIMKEDYLTKYMKI